MRALFVTLMTLAPILLLVALGVGLGYVRLMHGPVAVNFLVEPIVRGINAELDGLEARIDGVVVSLSDKGGLEFQLQNVRLLEADGNAVVSAPLAAVEMSLTALRSLRLVPSRVELIEPQLYLFYSPAGGLTLSFSTPSEEPIGAVPAPIEATRPGSTGPSAATANADSPHAPYGMPEVLKRIDLARVLTETTARARRGLDSTSYLREFGLRDATVILTQGASKSRWHVPAVLVDLEHRRNRSIVSGMARIASERGPWTLTFRTEDSEATQRVTLKTSVRDLVPSSLASALPQFSLLQAFDLPVGGDATIDLSLSGDLIAATLALELAKGKIRIPALAEATLGVDAGLVNLSYKADRRRLAIAPSTLRWADSQMTLSGHVAGTTAEDGDTTWRFDLRGSEGTFAASEFAVPAVPLDSLRMTGIIDPEHGLLKLEEALVQAGGATISLAGTIDTGAASPSTHLEGKIGPMPLAVGKALWPRALAPGARSWVGEHVTRGTIKGGTLLVEGAEPSGNTATEPSPPTRLSFALEAETVGFIAMPGMGEVEAPRVLVRVENDDLEIVIPDAALLAEGGRRLPVKGGKLAARDLHATAPNGEITFKIQAPLPHALDVLRSKPLSLLEELPVQSTALEGKFDGSFKLLLPLVADLKREAVRIEGQARITDVKGRKLVDSHDVQSATLTVDFNETVGEVSGEILVAGVTFKVNGQRIFDAPPEKQPPLRITSVLDNADRSQLGIDINHFVQGEVPVEITVTRGQRSEPSVQLRADLTNAELVIEAVAWRKPPGRSAFLQFDIAEGKTHKRELQNLKIAGDSIAIEGWAGIGPDSRLREFYFPDFSLDVVTRLEVQGKLGSDNVWAVKARGPTFDGRNFFRSLFSVGQVTEKPLKPAKPREGVDVEAEIDNVIGFSEVSMRGLKLKMQRRGEQLVALNARATLDGGKPLAAVLDPKEGGPRKLRADSTDAGQAFKMTGFYPNVQGGRVRLEVNLDGRGAAEKTGTLWVEDFRILGDPVVSEVFGGVEESKEGKVQRKVVRQVFDFDRMRVPFSVGHGQFAMEDSYLKGPLIGAHIRGKVDYKSEYVNLGGTYIPLQGINNAFENIPLLGDLLSGPRGEGIFGITFAIQGPMATPQATVNPLSVVAPGIFRELFQLANPDARVRPREDGKNGTSTNKRVRASSSSATAKGDADTRDGDILDGWSSETKKP